MDASSARSLRGLDTNYNGLSVRELQQKVDTDNNGTISADEAQAKGINTADLPEINQRYGAHASEPNAILFSSGELRAQELSHFVEQNFDQIDQDGDGYLSSADLNAALHSSQFSGDDAAAVATLYSMLGDMEEFADDEWGDENDGVTRQDVQEFLRQAQGEGTEESRAINGRFGYAQSKVSSANRELFPNGVDGIRPDSIEQALIGDCYYLAAIGSMARTPEGRQHIHDMIQDNHNGTYTVSFPGQDPVTIDAPTDAERALYSSSGQDGDWLAVLEKGYAQLERDNNWVWDYENQYDEIGNGGMVGAGVAVMTGHSTDTDMLSLTSNETTHQKLSEAMANGRVVAAGIRGNMPFTTPRTDNGLPMGHAYSVTGYNPETREVTLRNPWGSTGGNTDHDGDGTFTMSLEEFTSTFSMIAYEQAE